MDQKKKPKPWRFTELRKEIVKRHNYHRNKAELQVS